MGLIGKTPQAYATDLMGLNHKTDVKGSSGAPLTPYTEADLQHANDIVGDLFKEMDSNPSDRGKYRLVMADAQAVALKVGASVLHRPQTDVDHATQNAMAQEKALLAALQKE
jgi:hypothetical protein